MLHCLRAVTRQRRPRAPLAFHGQNPRCPGFLGGHKAILNKDMRPVHFQHLVMESAPYAH